ncbi:hypothetical protein WICPIJ_008067 [Wickerhamomyces pijperi]|uniref:Uncharacterized protein n=1 Tax=Wickerhamomyces pijperi TaxID=599730 RepID=A0A9P8TJ84_WICPI|nr:hypothetical protein WICPIJ_008067 [Wickerhamomyces pijperi]
MISLPSLHSGMVFDWIGVGLLKPSLLRPCKVFCERPHLAHEGRSTSFPSFTESNEAAFDCSGSCSGSCSSMSSSSSSSSSASIGSSSDWPSSRVAVDNEDSCSSLVSASSSSASSSCLILSGSAILFSSLTTNFTFPSTYSTPTPSISSKP